MNRKIRSATLITLLRVVEADGDVSYYHSDGSPFDHDKIYASGIVTPMKPNEIKRKNEEIEIERISSVGSILKSHAKKEMPKE